MALPISAVYSLGRLPADALLSAGMVVSTRQILA
jgi:hypothetical protein